MCLQLALLFTNATISFVEESNADKAIKALTSGGWPPGVHTLRGLGREIALHAARLRFPCCSSGTQG